MPPTTFVKLDRSILNWRWYRDANTARLFIHLLLNANIRAHDFECITVHRGELVTSQPLLAAALGLSVQEVRTALKKLQKSGEITVSTYPKFSLVSVLGFDEYQSGNRQATGEQQASNSGATGEQQASNNNQRSKEIKNERMEEVCVVPVEAAEIKKLPALLPPVPVEDAHARGREKNVYLTDAQYDEARARYGNRTERLLDELSLKISLSPARYPPGTHAAWLHHFAEHDRLPVVTAAIDKHKKTADGLPDNPPSFDLALAERDAIFAPVRPRKRQVR